jgi:phage tail-like protein
LRRDDWLLAQLPMGMLEDDFFVRFVGIFQEVATTIMEGADNLDNIIDITVAPAPMVRYLGSWLGIESIDGSLDHEVQRRIVRETGQILAWRGTRRGLVQFLELLSGGPVEVTESGGVFAEGEGGTRPATVSMSVETTGWLSEQDFVKLVRDELPAQVTFELQVGDRRLWPESDVA